MIVGDGGFVFALEKRGYVKAGPWTPEAVREYPEAGKLKFPTKIRKLIGPEQSKIKAFFPKILVFL